jgi:hypothetical protein
MTEPTKTAAKTTKTTPEGIDARWIPPEGIGSHWFRHEGMNPLIERDREFTPAEAKEYGDWPKEGEDDNVARYLIDVKEKKEDKCN